MPTPHRPLPSQQIRLLLVEDSDDDATLVVAELERAGFAVASERVDTRDALERALDVGVWDLVVADYSIPGFGGALAFELVSSRAPDLPFIFVSGTVESDVAIEMVRRGARDYVDKRDLSRLRGAVDRELRESAARRRRRSVEHALSVEEQRARRILESAGAVLELDLSALARQLGSAEAATAMLPSLQDLAALRRVQAMVRVVEASSSAATMLRVRRVDLLGTLDTVAFPGRESLVTELVAAVAGDLKEVRTMVDGPSGALCCTLVLPEKRTEWAHVFARYEPLAGARADAALEAELAAIEFGLTRLRTMVPADPNGRGAVEQIAAAVERARHLLDHE